MSSTSQTSPIMRAVFSLFKLYAKEPAVVIGFAVSTVATLVVIGMQKLDIIVQKDEIETSLIPLIGPPLLALLIRNKVYSPATVEGMQEGLEETIIELSKKLEEKEDGVTRPDHPGDEHTPEEVRDIDAGNQ